MVVNTFSCPIIVVVLTAVLISYHTRAEARNEINSTTKVTIQSTITRSVSGFIRDDASGEPIAYANVFLAGTPHGSTTSEEGYFVLSDIVPGSYKLSVTMIGYRAIIHELTLAETQNSRVDIRLTEDILQTEGVTVEASYSELKKSVQSSQIKLDIKEINSAPAFIEADVMRTLQMLPGVQTANDFSSALYVRGSTPDQNLILLDGITVYNPSHLGGIFSTFNTDAINDARFQAGGFPVRYGGRMGATLNIVNREGNTEKISGSGNISLISSKGLLEGPIPTIGPVQGSWMISARRTYLDQLVERFSSLEFPYHFYDYQIKTNLEIGPNHRLTYSRFYGRDVLDFSYSERNTIQNRIERSVSTLDWPWGNRTNGLTWRWIIAPTLIAKTFLSTSDYRFEFDFANETTEQLTAPGSAVINREKVNFEVKDNIDDRNIDSELLWKINEEHDLTTGIQHKEVSFDLDLTFGITTLDTSLQWNPLAINSKTRESAFYIQYRWTINPRLSVLGGLRATDYSLHDKLYLEPRIGAKFAATEKLFIKYNWGLYRQFLVTANSPDEVFRIVDLWFGVPGDRNAPLATHNIFGVEYLSNSDLLLRLEAYHKGFDHLLTLKNDEGGDDEQLTALNDFWDTDAESYGLELLIKKSAGRVRGWIGYTYARTQYFTPLSEWYAPNFDRTHTLNMVATLEFEKRGQLSASASYATGNPHTPLQGRASQWTHDLSDIPQWSSASAYLVGSKNSARHKPYFRVDLGYVRPWGPVDIVVQAINITDHVNPLTYQYRTQSDPNTGNKYAAQRRIVSMFPPMLSFGVKFAF